MENGNIESYNRRLRDGYLNVRQFLSVKDAQAGLDAGRRDYNHNRPHNSLGHLAPAEYALQYTQTRTLEAAKVSL